MLTASKGLREHLLAAQAGQTVPTSSSPPSSHDMHLTQSPGHHIDPQIGGGGAGYPMPMGDSSMEDQMNEVRKGRRELSTSKRAAQNRAAQRAFRQRKEHYINSLKDQVKEQQNLAASYDTIQKENFQLRQYIITLQARLLESHTELPPPPDSVDLSRPLQVMDTSMYRPINSPQAPTAPMSSSAINELQAAAAAAAEASEGQRGHGGMRGGYPGDGKAPAEGICDSPSIYPYD
jgi:type II secretory pathway pseudopilin PulG